MVGCSGDSGGWVEMVEMVVIFASQISDGLEFGLVRGREVQFRAEGGHGPS